MLHTKLSSGVSAQRHVVPAAKAPRHLQPHLVRPGSKACAGLVANASSQLSRRPSVQTFAAAQETSGDVYIYEPRPLDQGERKHVISILVADEAGLINRVAGVFARRGANIESLAVGLTATSALFTVVVTGTETSIATLVKNLSKLVNVRYVEDLTECTRVEREMVMIKVRAPPGEQRSEVMQLVDIFRARIQDVSEQTMTVIMAGDPGKLAAFQKSVGKFGIIQIARTGRICLQRGANLNRQEMGTKLEQQHLDMTMTLEDGPHAAPVPYAAASPLDAPNSNAVRSLVEEVASETDEDGNLAADVYAIQDKTLPGVWQVRNILDPTFSENIGDFNVHTLSIEVEDVPGVLNQVTGCFARRGYNIQSLAVGPSEEPGMSRITMVVPGDEESIAKLFKQLNKIVYVEKLEDLTARPFVQRELMLVKVRCTPEQREQIKALADIYRANIVDVSHGTAMIQILGKADKLKAFSDLLAEYRILEIARTGSVALSRDSGVDTNMLSHMEISRIY